MKTGSPTADHAFFQGARALYAGGLEEYAERQTSPGSELVQELARDTRADRMAIMLSDPTVGRFLTMMASLLRASLAVEVGTFTGHGALCIAEGLAPGGRVITCEISADVAARAQSYFDRSELRDRIELRLGPALETIRSIQDPIDLAFIDGDKAEYWASFDAILDRLAPNGLIVVDNTLMFGGVLLTDEEARALHPVFRKARQHIMAFNQRVREDPRVESCLLTVSDGLTLIRRRGAR